MKPLSASQAAKAVGKSVPTITRAIKSGKLSAEKVEGGGYLIEPSELFRVWEAVTRDPDVKGQMFRDVSTQETSMLQAEIATLHAKLEMLEESRKRETVLLTDQVEDLKKRLDEAEAERRNLSQRLLAAPEKTAQTRKGFFGWFGARTPESAS